MKSAEFLKACRRKYSNTGGLEIQSIAALWTPKNVLVPLENFWKETIIFFSSDNHLHMKGINFFPRWSIFLALFD
jgi:hypothetical protein